MTDNLSLRDFADAVLDPGSFTRWDECARHDVLDEAYGQTLAAAAGAGVDEAIVTGAATVDGQRVAVVLSAFEFLAGSLGSEASERVVRAFERATRERLPVITSPRSGGTRMQEGAPAFAAMIAITRSVEAHRLRGLLHLTYLRHPTTGGALASWGSRGHFTYAQPGAFIGLLGSRAQRALGTPELPAGIQNADALARHGVIDGTLTPREFRLLVAGLLQMLSSRALAMRDETILTQPRGDIAEARDATAADIVARSERPDRPGAHEFLAHGPDGCVLLSPTADHPPASPIRVAVARFGAQNALVIAQDREAQQVTPVTAGTLRHIRRAVSTARSLGLPIVTIIDTKGIDVSAEAESQGLAGEVAACLAELATYPLPVVSTLLGQGAGAAAIALLPADRTLAAQHAWLAPLPFPAAGDLLGYGAGESTAVAERQRVRATDLMNAGIVDSIVPELPDAAEEPLAFIRRMSAAIAGCLDELAT